MKALIVSFLLLALSACAITNENLEPQNDSFSKINGQWKYKKTGVGYPVVNGPTEIINEKIEILTFDSVNKTFTRSINGQVTETTSFDIQKVNYVGIEPREAIIFQKSETYSFLTFDDANSCIILYEKTPVGVVLADGNSYYYQKVK
ncbi:hypothetical protein Emtol_0837 [Emticicia oligotrophica DSM 17448]|uniref:Lipocalin-like domain-containing protein n=1 Tax=Emticicia oligotrophica (strain DSM 17448 / CIP 109782 / MTCC 6937 / GPTSA100-15) TaxID=929562 RepID=A0ABM5MXX7_EMTOG|nr:hypothetical protein [Emticicia oligotrophica]AFK01988.1 hypothetical protein Emtol_0837 [Emticicia oligotrophica DSM 17448]